MAGSSDGEKEGIAISVTISDLRLNCIVLRLSGVRRSFRGLNPNKYLN